MMLKILRIMGISIWSICLILLVLVMYTKMAFTNHLFYPLFIFTTTSGLPLILFLTATVPKYKRSFVIWFFTLLAATAIGYKTSTFLYFGSGFKTQTITHRSLNDPEKRIEFQLEDFGALGYNRRTIIITPICCFLQQEQEIDPDKFDYSHWKQVDEEINELGLKFP